MATPRQVAGPPSDAPPSSTVADDPQSPIGGMPPSYRAPVRPGAANDRSAYEQRRASLLPSDSAGYVANRNSLYFPGAERTLMAGRPPEEIASIQRLLKEAGLLSGTFTYGFWDNGSASAFKEVLGYANQEGIKAQDALDELAARRDLFPQPDAGPSIPAFVAQQTSPDELRRAFRSVTEASLGRRLSDDELEPYIAGYQQAEVQAQQARYGATYSSENQTGVGPGGTFTAPADPQSYLQAQLEKDHPTEVGATDIASTFDSFLNILGGIGG